MNIPSFISNCAIGGFNLKGSDPDSRNANGFAVCLVCQPGFSPVFLNNSFVITDCVAIPSCGTSLILNECSFCTNAKIYNVADDSCLEQNIKDEHCLFGSPTECYICEPEYSVNLDKLCEKLDAPNCSAGYSFLPNGLRSDNLGLFLTISSQLSFGGGVDTSICGKCAPGFLGISKLPLISTHCLASEYLSNDEFRNQTQYIPNCLRLKYNYEMESFDCSLCKSGYMPSYDRSECVTQTSFCLQGSKVSDQVCNMCKEGYSLANGKCLKDQLDNCKSYYTDSEKIFCKECESGFVKDYTDLECTAGEIPNCSVFRVSDPLHCLECKAGYKLIRNNLGRTICLDAVSLNCDIWEDDAFFSCTQCADNFHPEVLSAGQAASYCVGGNFSIENCSALDSEFACSLCDEGFYLSKNRDRCLALSSPLINCEVAMLDIPECKQCETGYYLKEETRKCFPFPSGISNCVDYTNESTCSECATGFYLSENQCKEVSEPIANCVYYSSNTICKLCSDGKAINPSATGPNDTCTLIQAQNCKTASNILTCSSCEPGFGLHHSGNSVDCKSIQSVPYCVNQDFNAPYNCLECNSNSFLTEGLCDLIVNQILQCISYRSQTQCKTCNQGYLLKSDGSACEKIEDDSGLNIDSNCESVLQDSRGFSCNACDPGHYLTKGGVCFPVSSLSDEHTQLDHCAFYTDISKKKCQICRSGYNMDNLGLCLKNNEIPDPDSRDPTPENPDSILLGLSLNFIAILSILI